LYDQNTDFVTTSILKTGIYEQNSTTTIIDRIVCDCQYDQYIVINNHGATSASTSASASASASTSTRTTNQHNHAKQKVVALDFGANIGFQSGYDY